MSYPDPKQTLVIQYNYLWHEQSQAGQDYAKDRPCLVVGVHKAPDREKPRVYVLPITTQAQADKSTALAIPDAVQRKVNLPGKSWVVTDQGNAFDWPDENLQPVPKGPKRGEWAYGYMTSGFYRSVHEQLSRNIERSRFRAVSRKDEGLSNPADRSASPDTKERLKERIKRELREAEERGADKDQGIGD